MEPKPHDYSGNMLTFAEAVQKVAKGEELKPIELAVLQLDGNRIGDCLRHWLDAVARNAPRNEATEAQTKLKERAQELLESDAAVREILARPDLYLQGPRVIRTGELASRQPLGD